MQRELQVIIIYAVVNNLLGEIPTADIRRFESELFEHISLNHSEIAEEIKTSGDLTKENEERIRTVVGEFVKKFTGGAV